MKSPTLFLALALCAPMVLSAGAAGAAVVESPIKLGPVTPEGFNDPAHIYYFRYQAYLKKSGLEGLDAAGWKALTQDQRDAKIKTGEGWLKDKLSSLMSAPNNSPDDALLSAIWGKDVAAAAAGVSKALALGDPEQIREARQKVQGLVKSVGGANMDWSAIFDGAAPGAVAAPNLPNPLGIKQEVGFLASLDSPAVRAPLASRATFVEFLQHKQVPPDAVPALTAMYDVLTKAQEPEKSQVAHILPTVVRFLNDGKSIRDAEMPGALAFAVPGEYDKPDHVGITSLARNSDPVEVGDILSHEFEHVYDMYAGRYYTLDSELRGFKTNMMFYSIMKKDPAMSKKLDQLTNSDDDATREFFQDQANIAATYAEPNPKDFADMVAFGHGYDQFYQGVFSGRLTLREATDPEMGIQRQISAENSLLARYHAQTVALQARLAEIRTRPSSLINDRDLEKTTSDFATSQLFEISLQKESAINTLRLNRMQRERAWMDKQALDAGQQPPPYDLNLPVSKNYVVSGE